MLMVVTTRPPFTYAFTTSLQYISILEKLYFLLFHVSYTFEVLKLLLLVWCCCYRREHKEGAQVATTVVAGGSLCSYTTTNQQARIKGECRSLQNRNRFRSYVSFLSVLLSFSL